MCAVTVSIIIIIIIIIMIIIIHCTGHLTKMWLKQNKQTKTENRAKQILSSPKSNLLYRENLDLNLCNKKNTYM